MGRKKTIRGISFLFIFIFIFSVNVKATLANENNSGYSITAVAEEFMSIASENPHLYGLKPFDLNNLQLSEEVIPYKYNELHILQEETDVKYYFICSEGKPIATLIVSGVENLLRPSVEFETDTAKKLDNYLLTNKTFSIILDSEKLIIAKGPKTNSISKKLIRLNIEKISNTTTLLQNANAYKPSDMIEVPIINQGKFGLCWAACVASVAQHKLGAWAAQSPMSIAYSMGIGYDDGANCFDIGRALTTLYDINNRVIDGTVPFSTMAGYINNGTVIIGSFLRRWDDDIDGNEEGHAVVICGYRASTQGSVVMVMDSNCSSYQMIMSGVDKMGRVTLAITRYSGGTFYWYASVIVD